MKMLKSLIAASVALAASFASVNAEDIAITGAKAHTMDKAGVVENATILIKDGKIVSVTKGGAVPEGYRSIDAGGKIVTPGLMNPMTYLGLNEVPSQSDNRDYTTKRGKVTAGLDITWALNPDSMRIPLTRIEGITRAAASFSSTHPFSGQGAVIHLNGDDMVSRGKAFIVLDISNGEAASAGSRAALWDGINSTLSKAKAAMPKKPAADDGKKKKSKKKKKKDAKASKPAKKMDANTKAYVRMLKGESLLIVNAHRKSDILLALKMKKKFNIPKMVIYGATEGWRVADKMAEAGVGAVITTINNLPSNFDRLGATLYNAARMSKAGVKVMFTGNGPEENSRLMPQHAGIAVAHGMSWDEAMKAMTVYPAEFYGVSKSYGTLSAGMDADVVVWDGDPLEVMSSPDAVIIRGQQVDLVSRQTKLRDRYKNLPTHPGYTK